MFVCEGVRECVYMYVYVIVKLLYGIFLHKCVAKLVHEGGARVLYRSNWLCMSANNTIQ